ncbi:MAG TPA: carboxypeptidase-like regulatory domain-containing protein [Terriglobales bacterium]|nr:carboxypeptidase-like regulatory domain-containing protein [Terriglobales bacterium]
MKRFGCAVSLVVFAVGICAGQQKPVPARQSFQIGGRVVNAIGGDPLGQTEVTIAPASSPNVSQSVLSGRDGGFLFENLAPGKYSLMAERRGFRRQFYEEHEGAFSTAIAVGPDLESTGLIFRLRPDGSISGVVTDEHGDPVRNAQVMLFHSGSENGHQSTHISMQNNTDDRGYYHFGHLTPGKFFIAVSGRPWYAQFIPQRGIRRWRDATGAIQTSGGEEPDPNSSLNVAYPITYYNNTTDSSAATPIVLSPGARVSADIALTPVPGLSLRVHQSASDPSQPVSPGLKQILFDGFEVQVMTNGTRGLGNGETEISGIPPGHFVMSLQSFNPNAPPTVRQREVDISSNAEVDAAESSPSVSVSGTVSFEGDSPPQLVVGLTNPKLTQGRFGSPISPNGQVEFQPLPPGVYEIFLPNPQGWFLKSLTATGAKVRGRAIEIGSSENVQLALVLSKGVGRIDGVVMRDDKPQGGVMVVLIPHDPENHGPLFRRDQSDSDGTFTLGSVVPGKYTVLAIENGWDLEWTKLDVVRPYLDQGESIRVEANGKYNVKVKVQPLRGDRRQ